MNCNEIQQDLPEIVDGGRTAEQEAHLKSCSACASLLADLSAITEAAVSLRAAEEPSPRVWNSIEIALRKEGLIRQPPREPSLAVMPVARRGSSLAWLLPVAAAILVGMALLLVRPRSTQRVAEITPPQVTQPAPATPSIDREDQQFLEMVSNRLPGMRAAYENNLRQVNDYIRDAQQSLQSDPNDEEAQQTLLDAYSQKAVVYDMAMDRSLP